MSTYTFSPQTSLYILHDRPIDQLPLRRLQKEGAEVLETNELLQIALGAVDGFDQLLGEYGIGFLRTLHSVPDIVETLKLDHLQATRLLAIITLGKRLFEQNQGSLVYIQGIEDVYQNYRSMANLAKEQLRLLLINSRHQLIHEEVVAIGSTEELHVTPKDIFQSAVERRVTAVILVHNHPSGDTTPSTADYQFSERIQQAGELLGIELLDHVVIGKDGYSSCLKP